MLNRRLARLVLPLALGSLVLTGCGSEDGDDLAAAPDDAATEGTAGPQNEADGVLTIGTLLPQTGSLAFLGPPEFAGVDLAAKEINEAGGCLGKPVEIIDADSGDTSTNIASQSVDRLLSQDVDVIIGAASSAVSKTVIDKITGAGVVQFSPANTSQDFTDYPDEGLYFRTAPPDVLQGRVLGNLIVEEGNPTVGILALQDAYGTGLAESVTQAVESANAQVVETVIYDPKAAEFNAEVSKIKAADPAAIVVIGFDESAKVIQELVAQGIGPQQGKKLYLVDGNIGNALGEKLPAGLLANVSGTLPGAPTGPEFRQRLMKVDPKLKDFSYAGESYDATVLSCLAAEKAGSDAGKDIAGALAEVSKEGEACDTVAKCLELLKAGEDIDYQGVSGPVEFNEAGDPTQATIGIYTYGPDNKLAGEPVYKEGEI